MRISVAWLKDFIKVHNKPEDLAKALTMTIAEVEDVESHGGNLSQFFVGQIQKIYPHPQADRLKLAEVNIGKSENVQVVCGAQNIYEGMLVIFAPLGSRVKWHGQGDWIMLERAMIRGQESLGMIAGAVEVGLSSDLDPENGVADLSSTKVKPGTPLTTLFDHHDTIFVIDNKTLTHRSDLFGHVGFAREIAASVGGRFDAPLLRKSWKPKKTSAFDIRIEDKKDCLRFIGTVLSVEKGETASVFKNRLAAVGMRSIHPVVDATNAVMMEWGQPLHAFDWDKLVARAHGKKPVIHVRRAKVGEKITTLDGKGRILSPKVLVVADTVGPIGIAGVMGGKETEVDERSTKIFLEAACFDPIVIRRSALSLGLRTEASARFEKGLPPELTPVAVLRAFEFLSEWVNAKGIAGPLDKVSKSSKPKTITLRKEFLHRLLGMDVPIARVKKILTALGCDVKGQARLAVRIPWWRSDLRIEEDLVEEVARLIGYEKIPEHPLVGQLQPVDEDPVLKRSREIREILVASGFTECYHYSFYGPKESEMLSSTQKPIEILNPLSQDLSLMRLSLLPQFLKTLEKNMPHTEKLNIFEVGHLFYPTQEEVIAGIAMTRKSAEVFRELKGVIEHIFFRWNISATEKIQTAKNFLEAAMVEVDRVVTWEMDGQEIAWVGEVEKTAREKIGVSLPTVFGLVNLTAIGQLQTRWTGRYRALPKYPAVYLDLAFWVDARVSYTEIEKVIKSEKYGILESVELFDVYYQKNAENPKKSLAFHLVFRASDRTLSLGEAQETLEKIIHHLTAAFNIEVRI